MPRLSNIGAASTGSFGFALRGRPNTIAISYILVGANGANNGGGGQVLPATGSIGTHTAYTVTIGSTASFDAREFNGT